MESEKIEVVLGTTGEADGDRDSSRTICFDSTPVPEINECIRIVLERGAKVRALNSSMKDLPNPALQRLEHEFEFAKRQIVTKIDNIIKKLRAFHNGSSLEAIHDDQLQTDDQLKDFILGLVSDFVSQSRHLRSTVTQFATEIQYLQDHPPGIDKLEAAIEEFRAALNKLKQKAADYNVAIPWQIAYSAEIDPSEPDATVEFSGGKITDQDGQDIWGEWCCICSTEIQSGARGEGTLRYRCFECSKTTKCADCHAFCTAMVEGVQQALLSFVDDFGEEAVADIKARAMEMLKQHDPHLDHHHFAETNHPVFIRIAISDAPNLACLLNNIFVSYANRPCFGVRRGDHYEWLSYSQIRQRAINFACGMKQLKFATASTSCSNSSSSSNNNNNNNEPTKTDIFVGICSSNRPEWYITDLACALNGFVSIGLQTTCPANELAFIIQKTGMQCVVCGREELERFFSPSGSLLQKCPTLSTIICMDTTNTNMEISMQRVEELGTNPLGSILIRNKAAKSDPTFVTLSGVSLDTPVISSSNNNDASRVEADQKLFVPDDNNDIHTLVFTSGSTGKPKGCVITKQAFRIDISKPNNFYPYVCCSWMSPALSTDRLNVWLVLFNGGSVGFARTGAYLFDDVRALNPTYFSAPPFVWNDIYSEYMLELKSKVNSIKKESDGADGDLLGDKIAKAKEAIAGQFSSILGSKIKVIGIGGAAVSQALISFLRLCFAHCTVIEGYGTSECGGITADGKVLPGIDVKLVDVPEMGYFTTDQPFARGEICVKSDIVIPGYFKDEEETRGAFTEDGYYRTGDIGVMEPPLSGDSVQRPTIRLIDRKKNFFKLSIGEFVSPGKLETIFQENSPNIQQIFIYGNSLCSFVVAVVVPTKKAVENFCQEHGLPPHHNDNDNYIYSHPEFSRLLLNELRQVGQANKLRAWEIPRAVILDSSTWTIENGLVTPSLKPCRHALVQYYRDRLDNILSSLCEGEGGGEEKVEEETAAIASDGRAISFSVFLKVVAEILDVASIEDLDPDRSFADLGGTSLTSIVARIRRLFAAVNNHNIISAQILINEPLRRIYEILTESGSGGGGGESDALLTVTSLASQNYIKLVNQVNQDANMPLLQMQNETSFSAVMTPSPPKDLLVTGCTGFLGIHLLKELLAATANGASGCQQPKIYCLIRTAKPQDDAAAAQRLRECLMAARLWDEEISDQDKDNDNNSRIVALSGNVSEERFGLAEPVYCALCAQVAAVYHSAAEVAFFRPYSALRATNVLGTLQVIRFASTAVKKTIHHISTISVIRTSSSPSSPSSSGRGSFSATAPANVIYEDDPIGEDIRDTGLLPPQAATSGEHDGYSISKWVAERLVARARTELDLDVAVYRPGLISWHSESGHANLHDWLIRFIRAVIQLRAMPVIHQPSATVNIVPVDYVSKAIVTVASRWLMRRSRSSKENEATTTTTTTAAASPLPRVFHVVNNNLGPGGDVPASLLLDWVDSYFLSNNQQPLKRVPFSEWLRLARNSVLLPLLPFFGPKGFPEQVPSRFDDTNLRSSLGLESSSSSTTSDNDSNPPPQSPPVCCPEITEPIVHKLVAALLLLDQ